MSSKNIVSYRVIFERAKEGGYIAYVPILPGCMSQGETFEETKKNIKDAIKGYIEVLREDHDPIPLESEEHISLVVNIPITKKGLTCA